MRGAEFGRAAPESLTSVFGVILSLLHCQPVRLAPSVGAQQTLDVSMPAATARSPRQLAHSFSPNTKYNVSLLPNWVVFVWEPVPLEFSHFFLFLEIYVQKINKTATFNTEGSF